MLNHLKYLNTKIAFLQETLLKPSDHLKLRWGWVGQSYHSSFSSKARGAAIIIHKSVPFSVSKVISDPNGRFIIITGKISGKNLILANIYGPNWDNPEFFRKTFSLIPNISTTNLIIGVDFNVVLDTYLDRSSTQRTMQSNASNFLMSFINNTNLFKVWRILDTTGKAYSFHSWENDPTSYLVYYLIKHFPNEFMIPIKSSSVDNDNDLVKYGPI